MQLQPLNIATAANLWAHHFVVVEPPSHRVGTGNAEVVVLAASHSNIRRRIAPPRWWPHSGVLPVLLERNTMSLLLQMSRAAIENENVITGLQKMLPKWVSNNVHKHPCINSTG